MAFSSKADMQRQSTTTTTTYTTNIRDVGLTGQNAVDVLTTFADALVGITGNARAVTEAQQATSRQQIVAGNEVLLSSLDRLGAQSAQNADRAYGYAAVAATVLLVIFVFGRKRL